MDKSFQIIRTNPRLTTNYKIVVSSDEKLYLESFDSTKELSNEKYKHYLLPIDAILEDALPKFYDGIPKNTAFKPKLNDDVDIMYDTYDNQYDNIYYSGSKAVNDQWYSEEFEYFAPLYVVKNELPSNFVIMRVDDPVIYSKDGNNYVLGNLNKDNFQEEIIDKWKCVKNFDLTTNTTLGNFLDRNIISNNRFPDYSFFFDTKKYNFSKWYGMDYATGVYTEKEMYLDDYLGYQKLHYELEDFITKGYEDNSVIYPYIMNLNFLFDDEPATPNKQNKYSMNRYFGFYIDEMEHVDTITTYNLKALKSNLYLKNNIFLTNESGSMVHVNPFVDETIKSDWILYNRLLYEVREQENGSYKLISEQNFSPNDATLVDINQNQTAIVNNELEFNDTIDAYINKDGIDKTFYADLYLIEIDGIYHVLKNNPENDINGNTIRNNYYIQSDYNIFSNSTLLRYWKGGEDSEFSVSKSTLDDSGKPLVYTIYRANFTEIKDFDFDRVNTRYSDFDYEQSEYVETHEKKLTAIEYADDSIPRRKKTIPKNSDGQHKTMNISSEYIADDELFEVRDNHPASIWDKSQTICKWGYRGSISHCDYPYKINTLLENGGIYNRTTNTESSKANAIEKNIDYLYRIGELYGGGSDYIVNYMDFIGTSLGNNGWVSSSGTPKWYVNRYINGTTPVADESGNLLFYNLSGSETITHDTNLVVGEYYYISFTVTNLVNNPGTEVGIEGVFDTDIIIEEVLSYNYSGTLKAISTDLVLTGTNGHATFSNFIVIKVSDLYYYNQTTNIQSKLFNNINLPADGYKFNLGYYIDSEFDYFEYFFSNNMYYSEYGDSKIKPYVKYSIFNSGDSELPAVTSFKGIEYRILGVDEMVLESETTEDVNKGEIRNIIYNGGSKYNGYKFASILSETYKQYNYEKLGTTIEEENILPNGFSAWYNAGNGLSLDVNGTLQYTDYDIVPIEFDGWEVSELGGATDLIESNFSLYPSSYSDKPIFEIVEVPVENNDTDNGGSDTVYGVITKESTLLDVGNNTYTYDVELRINWSIQINGYIKSNQYELELYSDSFKIGTTPLIDGTKAYDSSDSTDNGGKIVMIESDPNASYNGTITRSGYATFSITGLTFEEATNIFELKYQLKHTDISVPAPAHPSFFNHTYTRVTIDRLGIQRKANGAYDDNISGNDKVHIIKTSSDTIRTNIFDTQPNLVYVDTNYSQQFSKLDDAPTFKYNFNFKFRWKTNFESIDNTEHFKATFYLDDILDYNGNTSWEVVLFDEQGTTQSSSGVGTSTPNSSFSSSGGVLGFPIQAVYGSGYVSKSGIQNIYIGNASFIDPNNEVRFRVRMENTLGGSANDFENNIETYVELVEVTVDRQYPSLDYTNPELDSSSPINVTIAANNRTGEDGKYDDIMASLLEKDGLHVIVNEKYKNILVINNKVISINKEWGTLNNVNFFGNNHGIYYGRLKDDSANIIPYNDGTIEEYNPDELTAKFYMSALNNLNDKGIFDDYVNYYVIDENGNFGKTPMVEFNESGKYSMANENLFNGEWGNFYPPFILSTNEPDVLTVDKSTYEIIPDSGPIDLLNDQYLVYRNGTPLSESVIDEPLARYINKVNTPYRKYGIYHGEDVSQTVDLNRFVGYYEPIFHTIPLYDSNYIWKDDNDDFKSFRGNYKFNTDLDQFGYISEIMYSKVNEDVNVLKLKQDDNYRSIYPLVDEIGLSQTSRFIFLSPWDNNFYLKTLEDINFLELFKDPKEIKVERPVTAEISTWKVESPYYYYTSTGKMLYGNDNSTNQVQFRLNVKNSSSDDQEFKYTIKYKSNYGTVLMIQEGSTGIITAGATSPNIYIDLDRPEKTDNGVSFYEEYTRWRVEIELYLEGGLIMDTNNSIYFDIYNELVDYDIVNYTIYDYAGQQRCNDPYVHNIILEDNIKKLNSIPIEVTMVTNSLSHPASGFNNILVYYNNHNISDVTSLNITNHALIGGMTINAEGSGYGAGGYDLEYRNFVIQTKYRYYADYSYHDIEKIVNSTPRGTFRQYVGDGSYYPYWFGNYNLFDYYYDIPNMSGGYLTPRISFKLWNDDPVPYDALFDGKLYDGYTGNVISEVNDQFMYIPHNGYNFVEYFYFDFHFGLSGEPIEVLMEQDRMYYASLTMKQMDGTPIETIWTQWVAGYPKQWTPPIPTP